ncbi:adenylate/guanylate cyclase domain-containing protein [Tabrizicola piscis]|uniref:Adenylate/guanylate cyclase domain-containing protein n=1 Tax=Tabrizicola piscis TaxID=2494374 RepID=A0A3S8UAL3_9RHOB|nr:adenylate/guanylate cyclase domain-containing protein [Tabrizicola piscis]AZL60589.1 adenylate/guanylate cyclase domain-containing protein [Tabrizicola piscis]
MPKQQRRLVAIVSMDVAGFSRLIHENEKHTVGVITGVFEERILPATASHGGEVFKTMGDGILIEFASPVAAVEMAAAFQQETRATPVLDASGRPMQARIGIVLADVLVVGNDRFGEGVNLAVRLQEFAPPGGITISRGIKEYLDGKTELEFASLGYQKVKSIDDPQEIWVWPPDQRAKPVKPGLGNPGRPSIVILPFDNLSSDPEQNYFADGMTEELTATLSRIRDFLVIARNTAFTYKGRSSDVRQISQELGVSYVLEGSVRKSGDRLRVTAQLVAADTGAHIWSDTFEGATAEVFDLQDMIARQVAGAVYPSIRAAEVERAQRKRPDNLEAYDLVMQALPQLWAHRMDANAEAIRLLERALVADPNYGLAAGLAAWAHAQQIVYNWTADAEAERKKGLHLIEIAVRNVGDDPTAMTAISSAIMLLDGNVRRGVEFVDRALSIDPNHAWAWTRRGFSHVYAGESELALSAFGRAISLSPRDPFAFHTYIGIGLAHFAAQNAPEAVHWVRRALDLRPGMTWPYRDLAVYLAHTGEHDQARLALAEFTYLRPTMTLESMADDLRFMSPPLLRRYIEGLRLAGLPTAIAEQHP